MRGNDPVKGSQELYKHEMFQKRSMLKRALNTPSAPVGEVALITASATG